MKKPLIIGFVSDLYFSSRIEIVADKLGYSILLFGEIGDILQGKPNEWIRQHAEHLDGQGGILLDVLTKSHPVLVIFDLNNHNIPWQSWIALIKSAPATRRIPILGFGSHVQTEIFQKAKSAGADRVVARSKFVTDLPKIIKMYAIVKDLDAIQASCNLPLSVTAVQGLEEFNNGEYYEAHEYLEQAWMEDATPGRELYRAILQIAVAYLQVQKGNYRGTMKMFLRVRQWLDPLPDKCRGVNIAKLRNDAYLVQQALADLGIDGILDFDQGLLKPVEYSL